MIWQEGGTLALTPQGRRWIFNRDDLFASNPDDQCGVRINTIASLRSAAQERIVYLEYERDGTRQRAQLWPKGLFPINVAAFASYEQVVERQYPEHQPSKALARFRATETAAVLNEIEYLLKDAYGGFSQIERAELYCAAAGQVGVHIADLPSRSYSYQPLRSSDLTPTNADGPCGIEINTIASLVEAWLQGKLYVLVHRSDGMLLRGQIPHP